MIFLLQKWKRGACPPTLSGYQCRIANLIFFDLRPAIPGGTAGPHPEARKAGSTALFHPGTLLAPGDTLALSLNKNQFQTPDWATPGGLGCLHPCGRLGERGQSLSHADTRRVPVTP